MGFNARSVLADGLDFRDKRVDPGSWLRFGFEYPRRRLFLNPFLNPIICRCYTVERRKYQSHFGWVLNIQLPFSIFHSVKRITWRQFAPCSSRTSRSYVRTFQNGTGNDASIFQYESHKCGNRSHRSLGIWPQEAGVFGQKGIDCLHLLEELYFHCSLFVYVCMSISVSVCPSACQ